MGEPHEHVHDTEHRLRERIEQRDQGFATIAESGQRQTKQNCYKHHLQDVAFSKCVHDRRWNDVQQEVRNTLRLGLTGIVRDCLCVKISGTYVET
jgi:hypothetical protein